MTAWGIVGIIIAVLVLVYFALCAVLAYGALRRYKTKEPDPANMRRLAPHAELIRGGVKWLLDRNPEEVEIESFDGLRLRALYLPAENARCTAILMHGYRSDYLWDFAGAYELLHDFGCNLLVPWQRAHGRSEGRIICMGVKERRDCADWARYIEERNGRDLPIVLEGMSMGAATVLMATGLPLPENVCGVIADCGFSSVYREFAHVLHRRMHLPTHPIIDTCSLFCRLFFGFGYKDCTTTDALKNSELPLLLVHGEADNFVPAYFSRENFEVSAATDKTLVLVPGAAHGCSFLVEPERCKKVILAFYERLTGTREQDLPKT